MQNGWPTKAVKPYFQPGPLSGILTVTNIRQVARRIWTCAEPEFKVHHGANYTWQAFKLIQEHILQRGFQTLQLAVKHYIYKKWWYTETSSILRCILGFLEAVTQRCSLKKVFLKSSQSLQQSTCARASFLIKLQAWGL